MKYLKQLATIMLITALGDFLKYLLPFPIPGSIYGLVLLFIGLYSSTIKLESVNETGEFLLKTTLFFKLLF